MKGFIEQIVITSTIQKKKKTLVFCINKSQVQKDKKETNKYSNNCSVYKIIFVHTKIIDFFHIFNLNFNRFRKFLDT